MEYLKIDKPVGIKTTFASCPAISQWRRDEWRSVERNITVRVDCPHPCTHVHTRSLPSHLLFQLSGPLVRHCEESPGNRASWLLLIATTWKKLGSEVCRFSLEVDALVLSSRTQVLFLHCQGLCLLVVYSRISAQELPLAKEGASPRITTPS